MYIEHIKNNCKIITDRIKTSCLKAGRNYSDITVIAVTKYTDIENINILSDLGFRDMGESKVQQLNERHQLISKPVKWHMIGNMQSNKVKYIAAYIEMIHSVNKIKLIDIINRYAELNNRIINCFVEINWNYEETKTGAVPDDAKKIFDYYCHQKESLQNINLVGLMTMAPFTENETLIRKCFSETRELKNKFNSEFGLNMQNLSMGMTNDYESAVMEGSTHLRIGSGFFN